MADAHLVHPRDAAMEVVKILEAEVVAGVESQSLTAGLFGGGNERGDGSLTVGGIAGSVGLGVEFDTVGATLAGSRHHRRVGIDKDGRAYARLTETGDGVGQKRAVGNGVPTVVGRQLVGGIGDERHLCGTDLEDEVYIGGDGIALDVQFGGDVASDVAHVLIAYVALVWTRVDGDALGTEHLAVESSPEHVGIVGATRIAQSGYLIDVYA